MKTCTKFMATAMFVAAIFFGNTVKAQMSSSSMSTPAKPWRFGIGVETGMPTSSLGDITGWELGGTARLQYDFTNNFGIMVTSGYYNFFAGSNNNFTSTKFGKSTYYVNPHNLGIIPVKAGFKTFWNNGMYFSAEGGVGFETSYNEDKKLILSPGIGYASKCIDVGLRYENFSGQGNNYGLAGVRIAYGFGL